MLCLSVSVGVHSPAAKAFRSSLGTGALVSNPVPDPDGATCYTTVHGAIHRIFTRLAASRMVPEVCHRILALLVNVEEGHLPSPSSRPSIDRVGRKANAKDHRTLFVWKDNKLSLVCSLPEASSFID